MSQEDANVDKFAIILDSGVALERLLHGKNEVFTVNEFIDSNYNTLTSGRKHSQKMVKTWNNAFKLLLSPL